MDKHGLYLIVLGLIFFTTVVSLSALGESRLDVYVSLFTIGYLSSSAIFRPRRRGKDPIGPALLITFTYIVMLRVARIILGLS